ncbi:alpha/beta fold hydrolase [Pseudoduganella sp.]|uniref:alpha/beta fold hydrolase n=1 Tax=Pseudoduganella sp. TaxID=1880898 RepID=UPI0035AF4E53
MDKRDKWMLAGAALAAAFAVVHMKGRQAERALPPSGRFMEVDGVRLHYLERGSGPVLVLLHGNAAMAQDYEAAGLVDRLAQRYRVIAFDRPGFGYSSRPRGRFWTVEHQAALLLKALQQLEVADGLVLGHSWGTLVAMAMARLAPGVVRGLVLVSGYYYPTVRLDAPLQAGPAVPLLGDLLRHTISPLLSRLLWPVQVWRMFSPTPVPPSFRRLPKWLSLRPLQVRASAAESAMMVPTVALMQANYAGLVLPVVLLAGRGDKMADAQHHSGRLHRELLQSELQLVDGGHMLQHFAQDEIVAAVDRVAARRPGLAFPRPRRSDMCRT